MDNDEWIVIVPAMPRADAERRFRQWREGREKHGTPLAPGDVRVDLIRTDDGRGARRYRVRSSAIAAPAPEGN